MSFLLKNWRLCSLTGGLFSWDRKRYFGEALPRDFFAQEILGEEAPRSDFSNFDSQAQNLRRTFL